MLLPEIASLLSSVATLGTDLFLGQIPDEPDTCVTVLEYSGRRSEYVFGSANPVTEYPRIQVVCRGAQQEYESVRATAELAYRALAAVCNQTVSGTRYEAIVPLQPPFLLDKDESERILIAFNCRVEKGLSA